jgi:MFS family permease
MTERCARSWLVDRDDLDGPVGQPRPFGITAPFAAALMERFGVRRVVSIALLMVAAGSGLTVFMTASWQLVLLWGVIVGLGTGSMAMALVATVVGRWFVARRGLVSGILTAASATGQLIFLPTIAHIVQSAGWRTASLTISVCALAVVPVVLLFLRERPADVGALPSGGTPADVVPPLRTGAAAGVGTLVRAARTRTFWLLAGVSSSAVPRPPGSSSSTHAGGARPRHAGDDGGDAARARRGSTSWARSGRAG